jgi:DNA-binding CsgD family transcriptional regulator
MRPEEEADAAVAELVRREILVEEPGDRGIMARFRHPIVREVLLQEIGLARTRRLHLSMLRALEERLGKRAIDRAAEIALHVLGAGNEVDPERAIRYLSAAGRQALSSGAHREARVMLEEALRRLEGSDAEAQTEERMRLLEDIARVHQRLGRHDRAIPLLLEAREWAEKQGSPAMIAALDRRLALSAFWGGKVEEAFSYSTRGISLALSSGDPILEARLRLMAGACLRDLSRGDEARSEGEAALRLAEIAGNREVQMSARRTLLLLHTWAGPPSDARRHAEAVIELAEELGDREAVAQAHWATSVMEGLTGNLDAMKGHLERAEKLAEDLHSPLLQIQIAALWIELSVSLGDWERGGDLAAEAIRGAREMNQQILLPQLLILSGLIHLGRGEMAPAEREIEEAWEMTGRFGEEARPGTPHLAILAHAGKAALYLAAGRYDDALRIGEAGMALVDSTGYRAWAIHRLLPTMVEAALHLKELDRAEAIGRRLRDEAEHFGHPVGHIWADTCDGLVAWLRGDIGEGARRMAAAADRLEAVRVVPDAARLRRQLAGRLADLGDRDAAIRELRRVHDALAVLGAAPELEKARGQFREVGARPPTRSGAPGIGTLTSREAEIARLISDRQSNKAIAKKLAISPRTVGTHLTTIFRKLAIGTRGELADLVRDGEPRTTLRRSHPRIGAVCTGPRIGAVRS